MRSRNFHFQARRNEKMPTLVPSLTCMTGPEAAVYDTLGGHQEPLTALAMSSEGTRFASSSQDDTTKVWDLRTLRVVGVISQLGRDVLSLTFAKDDCCLVSGEKEEIRVWDLKSLTCLLSLPHEGADPALVCTADVGQRYLVAFFDGVAVMRVWNLKTLLPVCKKALPNAGGLHQDRTVVATPSSPGDNVSSLSSFLNNFFGELVSIFNYAGAVRDPRNQPGPRTVGSFGQDRFRDRLEGGGFDHHRCERHDGVLLDRVPLFADCREERSGSFLRRGEDFLLF